MCNSVNSLQREVDEVKMNRERNDHVQLQLETSHDDDTNKIREFQQKFNSLQAEVRKMFGPCEGGRQAAQDADKSAGDANDSRKRVTENEILSDVSNLVDCYQSFSDFQSSALQYLTFFG